MAISLELDNVSMNFKGLRAVNDFSAKIECNKIYGLIGTNGAGKTTIINMISGILKPSKGSILYLGKDITGMRADEISKLGILRTYQNIRLFKQMSAINNVIIGSQIDRTYHNLEAICGMHRYKVEEEYFREKAMEMLRVMGIKSYSQDISGSLPYGAQRKLEIARVLAASPKLVLLDEPAAGMNPYESAELVEIIKKIQNKFDLTILLVEHDMKVVMALCEYIYVMATGEIISQGEPIKIRSDPKVIEAYLGRARKDA